MRLGLAVSATLVFVACTGPTGDDPTSTSSSSTTSPPTTLAPLKPEAPWASEPLSTVAVPSALADAWRNAENRLWCSALAPIEFGPEGANATARRATFDGGWGVAWDNPEGPGSSASGEYCEECGRSAFGVAGVGLVFEADTAARMPVVFEWRDGSRAGYTGEGFDPDAPKQLAELVVSSEGCIYQVWSHLGPEHLETLIQGLRFVDGLQAEPLELIDRSRVPDVPGGPPPWSNPPLSLADVPTLIREQWMTAGRTSEVPLVVFVDDEGFGLAQIRVANVGTWGVAWDNPDGPGHDGFNQPCRDCGRGAVGLGAKHDSPAARPHSNRIVWDDGSFAEYGSQLADPRLPRERVVFNDPQTGEPAQDAIEARVVIAGVDAQYVVWSHLGEDHLISLLEGLRFVEP